MTAYRSPGVGFAVGLTLIALLAALLIGVDAFWDQFQIIHTPDGPAAVPAEATP